MSISANTEVPLYKRSIRKKNIKLKKDLRENWGRFLDNHYDPKLHHLPFKAAMWAPKDSYKFSTAGLSHKFLSPNILQSYDVEDKKDRTQMVVRFKEMKELEEGDIFVFIEYCSNSEKTQLSTSHSEEKYKTFAKRFRQAIIEKFPQMKVYIKSGSLDDKPIRYKVGTDARANIIDEQREPLRIGAFEITLSIRNDNFTKHVPIFSKLKTNCFPKLSQILSKLCPYVPKCDLRVNIFDDIKDTNDKPQPENAEGVKVTLKLWFNQSKAGEELNSDIINIENEKIAKTPKKRAGTSIGFRAMRASETSNTYFAKRNEHNANAARVSTHRQYRPYSAKTEFNGSFSRNPYSRRDFSNRMMSSQNPLNKAPSMKTLTKRPQTAASHAMLQSTASFSQIKTMESKFGGPNTVGNLSIYNRNKANKKKPRAKVQDLVFECEVDAEGIATFTDIPKSVYSIHASECDFFKSATKEICLAQEAVKDGVIDIYIPMERQDAFSTIIYMTKENKDGKTKEHDSDQYEEEKFEGDINKNYHTELELRAILLSLFDIKQNNKNDSFQSEEEEDIDYEENFEQTEDKNGVVCYKCRLAPGQYMVIAKGKDIKEFSQIINIEQQVTVLMFTPEKPTQKQVKVNAFDAQTGEPLNNVLLKLKKAHSKISSQGLTKEEGTFVYAIDENWKHILEIERKWYVPYSIEVNVTKGNEDVHEIRVPLVQIEKIKPQQMSNPDNEEEKTEVTPGYFRFVLISDSAKVTSSINLTLNAWIIEKETKNEVEVIVDSNHKNYEDDQLEASFDDYKENGKTITVQSTIDTKWFRLYAKITNPELISPKSVDFDHNFTNPLQDANVKLLIFNENKLLNILYAPSYIEKWEHWDIGLINMGKNKFIKINSCVQSPIHRKLSLKHYLNLLKYLNDQTADFNIKNKFGFGFEDCIMKLDDHVLQTSHHFVKAIKRLPIHWVSENIKDEELLQERYDELEGFFAMLPNCIKNVFGELSLKRLASFIEPNLGVHQQTPQKMHRTINKTSRRIYF